MPEVRVLTVKSSLIHCFHGVYANNILLQGDNSLLVRKFSHMSYSNGSPAGKVGRPRKTLAGLWSGERKAC
jgi:hypothetical protein